jgi:hypothetical protein
MIQPTAAGGETQARRRRGALPPLASALALLTGMGAAANAQDMSAIEPPSAEYTDVTATNLPQFPTLHALDAVFVDVDHDGDLDIAIAVEYGPNRLYLNDGQGRFSWREGAFGTVRHDNEHVRAADFDKDGNMDVIFVAESDEVHQLLLGDGKGGFLDVSDRLPAHSQGNSLAIGDLNKDGLPDIVVGNTHEIDNGKKSLPARNFLWLNDPAHPGHFIDATKTNLPDTDDQSEGLELADMDGDGDLDMLIASPSRPNRLLLNDGTGRFTDASDRLELKVPMETREVHVLDANMDGKPDILYFNLTSNNHGWEKDPQTRLLLNDGKGHWRDATDRLPKHTFSSWGGAVVDFNHDGAPDIIVSAIQVPGFVPLQVRAWQNDGHGAFSDVTLKMMPSLTVGRSWSIGQGDLDGDKKTDLFIGQWGTQARLLLTNRAMVRSQTPAFVQLFPHPKAPECACGK